MSKQIVEPDKGTNTSEGTELIPFYKVLLHNDDHNTMEHVLKALCETFRWTKEDATKIMMEAHTNGVALCCIVNYEAAELFQGKLQSYSLSCTLEPA